MCATIDLLGRVAGAEPAAAALVDRIQAECDAVVKAAAGLPRRPRVYFEEWNEPLITGIGWVSEALTLAGGEDVFAEVSRSGSAKDRVVASDEVCRRNPDIIFASWCGKKVRVDRITARPGWDQIGAVRTGHVHEIKSAHILQPGPAVLKGMKQMSDLIAAWSQARVGEARPA
jgi:iron complex transport system substrate-binding protein